MDLVLRICDDYLLDEIWSRLIPWPREYIPRQLISLCLLTLIGIHVLYFLVAWLSYKFVFNHEMMKHPRFLKDQVRLEIQTSLRSFPGMLLLTLPWFQAEVMGYSKMYDGLDKYGYSYLISSALLFVFFSHFHMPHKLTIFTLLVFWSSLTIASIGYTDGFISLSSTNTSTNHIINGSVRVNIPSPLSYGSLTNCCPPQFLRLLLHMPSTLWMVTCNRYLIISSSSFFLSIVSYTLFFSSSSIHGPYL